jgi:hypothetical protein
MTRNIGDGRPSETVIMTGSARGTEQQTTVVIMNATMAMNGIVIGLRRNASATDTHTVNGTETVNVIASALATLNDPQSAMVRTVEVVQQVEAAVGDDRDEAATQTLTRLAVIGR